MFSHSQISCFEQCPYKYKLKYIDKVRPEIEQTIEAFMGSMVHDALEKLYKDLRFQKMPAVDDIILYYNEQWEKNWNPAILIVRKGYTAENYKKMGEAYIRDYYESHRPFDRAKTVGLEQRIVLDLNEDGKYMLQGYIDRLAYAGKGVYEVHDYKTNFNIPVKQYLEDDRQLALYALAVLDNYQDARRVKLVWHFLSVDKEVVIEKKQQELDRLKKDIDSWGE